MTIGIDKIGFATSPYVLRLEDLATARDTDPEKLSKGLLLKEQSVAPITEDIVTLAAVSYTHLDVYKRQDLFSNPSRPGYDRAASPPELTNDKTKQ